MRNRPLGRTGLFVSELCLGTMTFGGGEGMWAQIGNLQQSTLSGWSARRSMPVSISSTRQTCIRVAWPSR